MITISKETWITALLIVMMVLTNAVDNVIFVRIIHKMRGFEWYLSQVIYPVSVCLATWPVVWFWFIFYKDYISESQRNFAKWKYFALAALAGLSNLLGFLPGSYVSGPVQVILSQSRLIMTMFASILFLGYRFKWIHYLGVCIIIGSVVLGTWNDLVSSHGNSALWISIYLLASIPVALGNVGKEYWIKGEDLNVWYFRSWDALFEIVTGLILAPIRYLFPFLKEQQSHQITLELI